MNSVKKNTKKIYLYGFLFTGMTHMPEKDIARLHCVHNCLARVAPRFNRSFPILKRLHSVKFNDLQLANTMKYGGGFLYNLVFTE